jgi:hypothetical protein
MGLRNPRYAVAFCFATIRYSATTILNGFTQHKICGCFLLQQDYIKIKALFQENFHGDEDADFYRDKFDEIQRKPKENISNYAFRLKIIYQRAYPSNKLETQEELASQLQFLRQKFLQGLESELQHIVRYKKVSTFEELVAVTQKYAKRVQLEQNDKDKKLFVNTVTNTQTDSLMIQAIEKTERIN